MNFNSKYKNKYWIAKYLDLIFKKLQFIEQQIEGGGSGGGNLQSVLNAGNEAIDTNISLSNSEGTNFGGLYPSTLVLRNSTINAIINPGYEQYDNLTNSSTVIVNKVKNTTGTVRFDYPVNKPNGTYTIATLSDIPVIPPGTIVVEDTPTVIGSGGLDSVTDVRAITSKTGKFVTVSIQATMIITSIGTKRLDISTLYPIIGGLTTNGGGQVTFYDGTITRFSSCVSQAISVGNNGLRIFWDIDVIPASGVSIVLTYTSRAEF